MKFDLFQINEKYSRSEVHQAYLKEPLPSKGTGNWTTAYVRPKNSSDLVVFLNLGIPGSTGHDFENEYNEKEGEVIWFGKPNSHSEQPILKKVINLDLDVKFFVRWNIKDKFTYLGCGEVTDFQDGFNSNEGKTIRFISKIYTKKRFFWINSIWNKMRNFITLKIKREK